MRGNESQAARLGGLTRAAIAWPVSVPPHEQPSRSYRRARCRPYPGRKPGEFRKGEDAPGARADGVRLVRHLARVVHLYHAFELQPNLASRDRLLDAIDARNAAINVLFDERGRSRNTPGWSRCMLPPPGHVASHLRLAEDGYQEPFANTCLNWVRRQCVALLCPGRSV